MITLLDVNSLETLLKFCAERLQWPIDETWFDDVDDLVYEFSAKDLGIRDEDFTKVNSLKQLRPLVDDQPWGIFAVDFGSNTLEVTVLRRIVRSLVPSKRNIEFKTWNYDRILFLCFWGAPDCRTIGFVSFQDDNHTLPVIKTLYCTPKIESKATIDVFEERISVLTWPDIYDAEDWINRWARFHAPARGQVIRDTVLLTETLARSATAIASHLGALFKIETDEGLAHQLYNRFNDALHIELTVRDFVDMYAQTIVYGLFSARCLCPEVSPFNAEIAVDCIPATNPLLRDLLSEYCTVSGKSQFDELNIIDLIEVLNRTDICSILQDFNRQTGLGKEDPIVYFYERFLDIYEHEQKKRRGVYYTPTPAVNFIVESISTILKESFCCTTGYLDPSVSVLDPATGTGTFLRSVFLKAHEEYQKGNGSVSGWSEYLSQSLLDRIHGFEFMMAPYAVAHMKLAMTLKDTGYDFSDGHRLQVYLANSLELGDSCDLVARYDDPLKRESARASRVKDSKINVILGNPPYRTDSINKGNWIMQLMEDYKHEPGTDERLRERNPKVVNDDYVKFIRFAQDFIVDENNAIVAYVTPHSFTDNLTFRGMRWNLMHSFDEIYVFDLHGNAMSRESASYGVRDENIFDIQQGICICFFVKKGTHQFKNATIYYADMFGTREEKYQFLNTHSIRDIAWNKVEPLTPYYFFKPKDLSQSTSYDCGIQLSTLFPTFLGGIKTHDDEALVSFKEYSTGFDQLYDYRPFDIRHINYDLEKIERPRYEVMKHFINHENFGLVMDRQVVNDNWSHIQIVKNMVDNRVHYSRKGIPVECPMMLYDDNGNSVPNINREELARFSANLDLSFSDSLTEDTNKFDILDLFDYCYGILSSTDYREKFSSLLCIDFPRVPVPLSTDFFKEVVRLGSLLRKCSLKETCIDNELCIEFIGNGDNLVSGVKYSNSKVFINRTQYFSNVPANIWDFCVGGYHGLQKWFKDRRQQVLSQDSILHVIDVFNIFNVMTKYMLELDELLSDYGIV